MKRIISIIGSGDVDSDSFLYRLAYETGKALADAGYRVQTGDMGGVMEAALRGARDSANYEPGDTIAILPTATVKDASRHADIRIPTALGHARNAITANAEAVVAIGGGSGTLSEIALAWTFGRCILAFENAGGWSGRLAGTRIDEKRRNDDPGDCVYAVASPDEVVPMLEKKAPLIE